MVADAVGGAAPGVLSLPGPMELAVLLVVALLVFVLLRRAR